MKDVRPELTRKFMLICVELKKKKKVEEQTVMFSTAYQGRIPRDNMVCGPSYRKGQCSFLECFQCKMYSKYITCIVRLSIHHPTDFRKVFTKI